MAEYVVHVTEVRRVTLRCAVDAESVEDALERAADGDCYDETVLADGDYDVLDRQAFAASPLQEDEVHDEA